MRPGDRKAASQPASEPSRLPGHSATGSGEELLSLAPILAGLSGEIRRPLDRLRSGIDRLLEDSSKPITEAERVQARAMIGLCDDFDRLTRECLEAPGHSGDD